MSKTTNDAFLVFGIVFLVTLPLAILKIFSDGFFYPLLLPLATIAMLSLAYDLWPLHQSSPSFNQDRSISIPVRPPQPEPPQLKELDWSGWIYILKSSSGHYKIGRTKYLQNRLSQLQTGSPISLKFVHSIKTQDMKALESELHHRFASKRVRGEWFNLSPEDVEYIKTL